MRHKALCLSFLGLLQLTGCPLAFAAFGAAKTEEGCAADHAAHDHNYLSGKWQPYIVTGPPEECDTQGCLDGFWAPISRFQVEPTCPKELVYEMTAWLRKLSGEGSWWARRTLTMQPCDMWKHLRGRTTWVIGDSVTEDVGHAIAELMLEYWDKENWNVTLSTDDAVLKGLKHGYKEGARDMGKRVPYWCFQMGTSEDPGRLCYIKADLSKRASHVLNLLPSISELQDVVLINLGIHYNDMQELEEDLGMLAFAMKHPDLPRTLFWVETAPQHYGTPTGMFNMSRPITEQFCFPAGQYHGAELTTLPDGTLGVKPGFSLPEEGTENAELLHRLMSGGERNLVTQPAIDALDIPTLRLWNISLPFHQFHTHVHRPGDLSECSEIACDCTHVCHPSWPQITLAHFTELMEHHAARRHAREHDHGF